MIYILLKLLRDNYKFFLVSTLALLCTAAFYATYRYGVNTERAQWEAKVAQVELQVKQQKEEGR